jgi:HAD superfamily hydrolase (TIGR01509 family)
MKTLIFDFNDTLSPSNFIETIRKYEDQIGFNAEIFVKTYINAGLLDTLLSGGYKNEVAFWKDVSILTKTNLQILLKIRQDIAESKIVDSRMLLLIRKLRRNNKTALLTDNVLETFDYLVEKFALNEYFDVIANSARYGLLKSNPEFYIKVLEQLNVKPQDSFLIDDYQGNLNVASSLGLRTILYTGLDDLESKLLEMKILSSS